MSQEQLIANEPEYKLYSTISNTIEAWPQDLHMLLLE